MLQRPRDKVCVTYVDTGGFCRSDCHHLHPADLAGHIYKRSEQLKNGVRRDQEIACERGQNCRNQHLCHFSHALDARGVEPVHDEPVTQDVEEYDPVAEAWSGNYDPPPPSSSRSSRPSGDQADSERYQPWDQVPNEPAYRDRTVRNERADNWGEDGWRSNRRDDNRSGDTRRDKWREESRRESNWREGNSRDRITEHKPREQRLTDFPRGYKRDPLKPQHDGLIAKDESIQELKCPFVHNRFRGQFSVEDMDCPPWLAAWTVKNGNKRLTPRWLEDLPMEKRVIFADASVDAFAGWPLIFFTVHGGRMDLFEYCLEQGTDPNILSPTGIPLLAFVILSNRNVHINGMVRILVEHGVDTSIIPLSSGPGDKAILAEWLDANRLEFVSRFKSRLGDDTRALLQGKRVPTFSCSPLVTGRSTTSHRSDCSGSTRESLPSDRRKPRETAAGPSRLSDRRESNAVTSKEVVIIGQDCFIDQRDFYSMSVAMGKSECCVLQAKVLEHMPEFRPRYQPRRDKANHMTLDPWLRRVGGRPSVIVVYGVFDCIQVHSTAFTELQRIWRSGLYISKIDGKRFRLDKKVLASIALISSLTLVFTVIRMGRSSSAVDRVLDHPYLSWIGDFDPISSSCSSPQTPQEIGFKLREIIDLRPLEPNPVHATPRSQERHSRIADSLSTRLGTGAYAPGLLRGSSPSPAVSSLTKLTVQAQKSTGHGEKARSQIVPLPPASLDDRGKSNNASCIIA